MLDSLGVSPKSLHLCPEDSEICRNKAFGSLKFLNLDTLADNGHRVCKDLTTSFPFHSCGYVEQEVTGTKGAAPESCLDLWEKSQFPVPTSRKKLSSAPKPVLLRKTNYCDFYYSQGHHLFFLFKRSQFFWFFMGFAQSSLWWFQAKWGSEQDMQGFCPLSDPINGSITDV